MLARWVRTWDSKVLRPLLLIIAKIGITPDALTIASLITVIISGLLLSQAHMTIGGFVLLLGGFLDGIDGELARLLHCETRFGAFLDSICDHYGDFAVYLGLLWLYLNSSPRIEIILLFLALFGSMLGSQVRSRAGMLGIDTKTTGLFTRCERILVLAFGIFADKMLFSLSLLAVMNNFSAVQRIVFVVQRPQGHEQREELKN